MTVFRVLLIVFFVAAGYLNGGGFSPVGLLVGLAFAFADKLFIGDDEGAASWLPITIVVVMVGLVLWGIGGGL